MAKHLSTINQPMLHSSYLFIIIFTSVVFRVNADPEPITSNTPILAKGGQAFFWWQTASNLQPGMAIDPDAPGWEISLALSPQTNFPSRYTWLTITNHVGSKLELWQTNGVPVISTNSDVLNALHLPKQTTVQEIMQAAPRRHRVSRWYAPPYSKKGIMFYTQPLILQFYFDISPTNDYVLQITPLIYKVETNEVTAHLVEFPPIKVKLMANGCVQKIDN